MATKNLLDFSNPAAGKELGFSSKVLKSALPSPAHPEYGAVGDGATNNTATYALYAAQYGGNAFFPDGIWLGTYPHQNAVQIEGPGPERAILRAPDRAVSALPILDIGGTGSYEDDFASIVGVGFDHWSSRHYDEPLIKITATRNFFMERVYAGLWNAGTAQMNSTFEAGTFIKANSAYKFEWDTVFFRSGRGAVCLDWVNDFNLAGPGFGGPPQADTFDFDSVTVIGGCFAIFRYSNPEGLNDSNDIHGFRFPGSKFILDSATLLGHAKVDTTVQGGGSAVNAATFTVNDATEGWQHNSSVRATGVGAITVGSMLTIEPASDHTEVCIVDGIAGNVITPRYPLKYAHAAGVEVIEGGIPLSFSGAPENIDLVDTHFERHQIGMATSSARGIHGIGVYSGVGQLIRYYNNTNRIYLVDTVMFGSMVDGSKGAKNEIVRRASNCTGTTDGNFEFRGMIVPAGASVAPINPLVPHSSRNYIDAANLHTSQSSMAFNADTTGKDGRAIRMLAGAVEKAYWTYNGDLRANQIRRAFTTHGAGGFTIAASDTEGHAVTGITAGGDVVNLPAAALLTRGTRFTVSDESNSASGANFIRLQRSAGDTIVNGTTGTTKDITVAGTSATVQSDGTSKWLVV
jgi:hypothetical protein